MKSGFAVYCFNSSGTLLTAIGDIRPDVILLDVNLGQEDGRTICTHLKCELHVQCPVVLLSANLMMKHNYRNCLADNFIERLFDLKILRNLIDDYIRA